MRKEVRSRDVIANSHRMAKEACAAAARGPASGIAIEQGGDRPFFKSQEVRSTFLRWTGEEDRTRATRPTRYGSGARDQAAGVRTG